MNLKQIQELIKFVAKSGATEVDLEIGDVKICIKSPPKGKLAMDPQLIIPQSQPPVSQPPVSQPPVSQPPVSQPPVSDTASLADSEEKNHITVKSPIIGTFYRRPNPDTDPFVNVGDQIEIGTVVGIVEAMKLFNEIESEVSGKIVKVLVDDMSPVEYDQPLFLVDPN